MKNTLLLVGRILISLIFVLSAVGKILNWSQMVTYVASARLPFPSLMLILAILFEGIGGLSVLLGFRARIGALLLVVFIIPAALLFHNFWHFEGEKRMNEQIHFLKDTAILGGLLLVIVSGAGRYSLDGLIDNS